MSISSDNTYRHWTGKICFAFPKFSTKFVSAKFSICQACAHWYTAKYLLTTKHHRLLTLRRKGYMRSQESYLTASIKHVDSICYIACVLVFRSSLNSYNTEAVSTSTMPVEASPRSTATFFFLEIDFSGLRTSILRLKIEIKFLWLTFSFKSWRVSKQICQISRLTKICPAPRQDDGVFEVW